MASTAFSGPLQTFTRMDDGTNHSDLGNAVLSQRTTIAQNGVGTVSATLYLPKNSQIVDIIPDVLVAYDSVTSATLTVGTAASGTQYAGSVDGTTAGRASITYTAAQLTAMSNVGNNVAVVTSVTTIGATTAGSVAITILYVQKES